MCGGSPLISSDGVFWFAVCDFIQDVGEITQGRDVKYLLSFSPL